MKIIPKKRRLEGLTDYQARRNLLKSGIDRVVFRKTNKYILGQIITSQEAIDKVVLSVKSKDLLDMGWPEKKSGSLKSLPASFLTGLLLGTKAKERKISQTILDIGLNRNIPKSRIYAFALGIIESGIKMPVGEKMLPEKERVNGGQIEMTKEVANIKQKIVGGK